MKLVKTWSRCQSLIPTGAFDREATAAMAEAYDRACRSIDDWGQPDIIKETIAQRIIKVSRRKASVIRVVCVNEPSARWATAKARHCSQGAIGRPVR